LDKDFIFVFVLIGILGIVGLALSPIDSAIPPTPAISMINTTGGNVTASNYNSFVTFVEGTGMSITPDYTLNRITFSASGSGANNTISSVGHGQSIVSGQVLIDHQLKGIAVTGDLAIASNSTDVILSYSTPPATGEANTQSSPTHANTLVLTKSGVDLPIKGIACSGSITCSSNSTDVTVSYTATGGGNMTTLDDAGDITLTSPANLSILQLTSGQWIDKIFALKTQSATNGVFITGINNQTGAITTQTFRAHTVDINCSDTQQLNRLEYNNSTGIFTGTCETDETGSGGPTVLGADVTCTATGSYCTIFTIPLTASSGNFIHVQLIADSSVGGGAGGVALQTRARGDDAQILGTCVHRVYTSATAETLDVLTAAGTPADTGETVWLPAANQPTVLTIDCAVETDSSSPQNLIVDYQMETAGTGTIQKGSHYIKTP